MGYVVLPVHHDHLTGVQTATQFTVNPPPIFLLNFPWGTVHNLWRGYDGVLLQGDFASMVSDYLHGLHPSVYPLGPLGPPDLPLLTLRGMPLPNFTSHSGHPIFPASGAFPDGYVMDAGVHVGALHLPGISPAAAGTASVDYTLDVYLDRVFRPTVMAVNVTISTTANSGSWNAPATLPPPLHFVENAWQYVFYKNGDLDINVATIQVDVDETKVAENIFETPGSGAQHFLLATQPPLGYILPSRDLLDPWAEFYAHEVILTDAYLSTDAFDRWLLPSAVQNDGYFQIAGPIASETVVTTQLLPPVGGIQYQTWDTLDTLDVGVYTDGGSAPLINSRFQSSVAGRYHFDGWSLFDPYPDVGAAPAVPLRLAQRNDGLALSAHPRLRAAQGATSTQLTVAPRVGGKSTYS